MLNTYITYLSHLGAHSCHEERQNTFECHILSCKNEPELTRNNKAEIHAQYLVSIGNSKPKCIILLQCKNFFVRLVFLDDKRIFACSIGTERSCAACIKTKLAENKLITHESIELDKCVIDRL